MEDEISIHFFDEKMQEDFELTNDIEQSQELALQATASVSSIRASMTYIRTGSQPVRPWQDERTTPRAISTPRPSSISLKEMVSSSSWIFFIFKKVLSDIKEALREGREVLPVSVNLSRIHFYDPDFFLNFENAIKESGVDPKCIESEITEGVILNEKMDLSHVIE